MNISSSVTGQQQRGDGGCGLFSCCLECPFPACIEEITGKGKRQFKALRDAAISELRRNAGASIEELVCRFHVSKRTVYRAIQVKSKNQK